MFSPRLHRFLCIFQVPSIVYDYAGWWISYAKLPIVIKYYANSLVNSVSGINC